MKKRHCGAIAAASFATALMSAPAIAQVTDANDGTTRNTVVDRSNDDGFDLGWLGLVGLLGLTGLIRKDRDRDHRVVTGAGTSNR